MQRILAFVLPVVLILGVALALRARLVQEPDQAPYDVLITGGRVLDGTGNPWFSADVAIRQGRIAALGNLDGARATRTIDARGRNVTPGFIDVHSHAATGLRRPGLQQGQPMLAQGVTTVIVNPDGGGPIDLAAQRRDLEGRGIGVNVVPLIGHETVRRDVLGMADRTPSPAERERMQALVRQAMEDGAFGLSSGLFYAPGSYATTEEVIALAAVVGEYGGVYTSHIRDEGDYTVGLVAAVDEVIRIAEEGGLRGIVSHMKALGPDNWGLSREATRHVAEACARGVEVFADQYPYDASSTSLTGALVPRWAQIGGRSAMVACMTDLEVRPRLLAEVTENIRRRGGPATLVIAQYSAARRLEGSSLEDVARERGLPPEEAALALIAEAGVSIVSFNMSEDDIEQIMRQSYTMASSDGGLIFATEGRPHPRNYGAFARRLERYMKERGTVGLEFAIRSMTSLPATVFDLTDRGVIRVGAWADIAIFDLDDEDVYSRIEAISDFVQQEPDEGAPATERTDIWVFFDDSNVYVSGRAWDSQTQRIVANEMHRDHRNINQNQTFTVVLDTFYDRRNGFFFQTNLLDALRDAAVTDERNANNDWNTVWDVKTQPARAGLDARDGDSVQVVALQ